jgi:Sodium/hydrogen exchanger family
MASTVSRKRALFDALSLPLLLPLAIAGVGCVAGQWLTVDSRAGGGAYSYLTYGLLAVGLYGSAYGIARPEVRADVYRIVIAITFGVAAKAGIVAGVLVLCFHGRPEYLVLAVAMAQIDPLSVSALMDNRDMSPRAKSLLSAWASFDDPVTTVLVVYISAMVLKGAGGPGAGTVAYASTLLLNLALLLAAAAAWWLLRRRRATDPGLATGPAADPSPAWSRARSAAQSAVLIVVMAVAVWRFLMLGLALSALFLRPPLDRWIRRATNVALYVATFLLGVLLAQGVHLLVGVVLGCATFAAQIVVGAAVSWGMPRRDRLCLCLSQQNGITAIILALLLQPLLPEAIGIIAPAILVVNVLHLASNGLLAAASRRGGTGRAEPPQAPASPVAAPEAVPAAPTVPWAAAVGNPATSA